MSICQPHLIVIQSSALFRPSKYTPDQLLSRSKENTSHTWKILEEKDHSWTRYRDYTKVYEIIRKITQYININLFLCGPFATDACYNPAIMLKKPMVLGSSVVFGRVYMNDVHVRVCFLNQRWNDNVIPYLFPSPHIKLIPFSDIQ